MSFTALQPNAHNKSAQQLIPLLTTAIITAIIDTPANRTPAGHPIFDTPLLGVANGNDPLFTQYKTIIGAHHQTPEEIIMRLATQQGITPTPDYSVICWVLPFSAEIRTRKQEKEGPSQQWMLGARMGEDINNNVRAFVEDFFSHRGILAESPVLGSRRTHGSTQQIRYTSDWSERHVLFAAGMGTFSLNDGFITERGIAMRCGSVVANIALPVTPRKASGHLENCLFFSANTCAKCMERCPVGAITPEGHDKAACQSYKEELARRVTKENAAYPIVGDCGLCQTGVPCESCNPSVKANHF